MRILWIFILMVFSSLAYSQTSTETPTTSPANISPSANTPSSATPTISLDLLNQIALNVNKTLPMKVGENFELMNVSVEGNTFYYHFQFTKDVVLKKHYPLEEKIKNDLCTSDIGKQLFANNIGIGIDIENKNGTLLKGFVLHSSDCNPK